MRSQRGTLPERVRSGSAPPPEVRNNAAPRVSLTKIDAPSQGMRLFPNAYRKILVAPNCPPMGRGRGITQAVAWGGVSIRSRSQAFTSSFSSSCRSWEKYQYPPSPTPRHRGGLFRHMKYLNLISENQGKRRYDRMVKRNSVIFSRVSHQIEVQYAYLVPFR